MNTLTWWSSSIHRREGKLLPNHCVEKAKASHLPPFLFFHSFFFWLCFCSTSRTLRELPPGFCFLYWGGRRDRCREEKSVRRRNRRQINAGQLESWGQQCGRIWYCDPESRWSRDSSENTTRIGISIENECLEGWEREPNRSKEVDKLCVHNGERQIKTWYGLIEKKSSKWNSSCQVQYNIQNFPSMRRQKPKNKTNVGGIKNDAYF